MAERGEQRRQSAADGEAERAWAVARHVARERDEAYAQLRTSEDEGDRYRRALRDIAETPTRKSEHAARAFQQRAREALLLPREQVPRV